jgi:uncharacterized protein involved in exopolysaccharide biosynthesis
MPSLGINVFRAAREFEAGRKRYIRLNGQLSNSASYTSLSNTTSLPDSSYDLATIKTKLASNARLIVFVVIAFLIAGLGYTLLTPAKYEARTTLYFPSRTPSLQSMAGGTAAESLGLGSSGPTPLKTFHGFLESETCLDYVSQQSGIDRKKIEDSRSFIEDAGANMLTLSVVMTDGDMARKILEYHLQALAQINRKISSTFTIDDTASLKGELENEQSKLKEIERDMVAFEKRANTAPTLTASDWGQRLLRAQVDLQSTKSALAESSNVYRKSLGSQGLSPSDIAPVRTLRPKLVEAVYQLSILTSSYGPDAPAVKQLESQIAALKSQIKNEVSAYVSSIQNGMIDPTNANLGSAGSSDLSGLLQKQVSLEAQVESLSRLAKIAPTEQGTLGDLTLKLTIQGELVKQSTLQYEAAKLQSLRDPNRWSLLDAPRTFPKPINKRYLPTALFSLLAGLFVSVVWVVNFAPSPKRVSPEA